MASKKVKIIAHCLVKNEERFIWYSIKSVIDQVDSLIIWDTGSTDATIEIVKTFNSPKIHFRQVGSVDQNKFTTMRQKMLDETSREFTWILILDGDEVWGYEAISQVVEFARDNPDYESIVVRTNNLVGDIYHRLPESAGHYQLAGVTGHLNLRMMNLKTIPGLNARKPHGQQGYFDKNGTLIQDRDPKKIKLMDVFLHHASHLQRSSSRILDSSVIKRAQKFKYEFGEKIPESELPEVFTSNHPKIVPDVTAKASFGFWTTALFLTPLKRLRRKLLNIPSGY